MCRSISAVDGKTVHLLRQLQRPLLLVKAMIPPRSPAVHLFMSLPVLPSHKAYLTSISVMESGASGSCLATTLLPASPLLLQHPPSHPPSRAQPLHSCCPFPDKMLQFCMIGLHLLLLRLLFICRFPLALICVVLERLRAAESIVNAEIREGAIITIRGCVQYVCFNH